MKLTSTEFAPSALGLKTKFIFSNQGENKMTKMTKITFVKAIILSAVILFPFSMTAMAEGVKYAEHFAPLPEVAVNDANPLNEDKVKLGQLLYNDPRLSKSGFISCNSCHNIATGGVDNLSTSIGHGWQLGPRNAPTSFNAALNTTQFWDGRAKDVEEQAGGPILNPGEMGESEENVLKKLSTMPEYVELFKKSFADEKKPLTYKNVAKAIAAFERTLLTSSRFDDYLNGDKKALNKTEKKGLKLFVEKGCVACHNGVNIGGNSFQTFNYGTDLGRFEVTKDENDKMVFRVPTLRNVELTYPYFHDGSVWDLKVAIKTMGKKQLKINLKKKEIARIEAFLKTLTGKQPDVKVLALPASGVNTPRPDVSK